MAKSPEPRLSQLFLTCLRIGTLSFGGGLSGWLYREFVVRTAWISDDEFAGTLTLAQIMPGANVLNLVACLGERLGGPRAAFICTLGFILPPILAVLLMAVMLDHVVTAPWVDAMMSGLAFAAMGLLLQICWHGLLRFRKHAWQLAVLAAVVICASGLGLSVPIVVAICGPVAIALAWRDAG